MAKRLTVDDIRGVVSIIPTPATADASDFRVSDTLDLVEAKRVVRALIRDGVDALMTNGTLGEMATLTRSEWERFAVAVAETVREEKPDLPLFIGATTLNTRDTVDRLRFLNDIGVRGALLGRPMWCRMDDATIVDYHQAVASAVPEMSFVLYDNPQAFKGSITNDVYRQLAENPQFVAIKAGRSVTMAEDIATVAGRIRIMPSEGGWAKWYETHPDDVVACWSSSAACGPAPTTFLRDALFAGDKDAAAWVSGRISWALQPLFEPVKLFV